MHDKRGDDISLGRSRLPSLAVHYCVCSSGVKPKHANFKYLACVAAIKSAFISAADEFVDHASKGSHKIRMTVKTGMRIDKCKELRAANKCDAIELHYSENAHQVEYSKRNFTIALVKEAKSVATISIQHQNETFGRRL